MSMRVTTKMVNEAAERAGIPINQNSLLSYVNGTDSNSLVDALNKKTAKTGAKNIYEKLAKAADELSQKASVFTSAGPDSIFAKAKESGSTEELRKAAQALVEKYNETIKELQSSTGTLDAYYKNMLEQAASENNEALKAIGITSSKNGMLSIDKDKLTAADVDTLEKALGSDGGFTSKVAFVAKHVADNARTNAENATSQYDAKGNTYTSSASTYDFWG